MYTAFYGLREKPFALVPDPRYLFLSESHREALAHLLYGIDEGEGFIAVTGEVGTGKTTICRTLLARLGSETEVAFLFNPSLSGLELLQDISAEFGLDAAGKNRSELGAGLNRFLLAKRADHRRVLLIIDEAQNLSQDTLEQVRLLSNLETSSSKLIQILLLGQPELDAKLDSPELRQLRQRISVRWGLSPLSARETGDYVRHRLQVAAGAERQIFTDAALREVHRRTGGVPRLVNVLCDRTLLAGYVEKALPIGPELVRKAAREIPDAAVRGWGRSFSRWVGGQSSSRIATIVAAVVVLCAVGAGAAFLFSPGGFERRSVATAAVSATPTSHGPDTGDRGSPPITPPEESSPSLRVAPQPASRGAMEPSAFESAPARAADLALDSEGARGAATSVTPVRASTPNAASLEAGEFLSLALAGEAAATARREAVDAILRSFGLVPDGTRLENDAAALEEIELAGLGIVSLPSAGLETLRALNHPALLRVGAGGIEPRLVALRQLEDARVWLYGLSGEAPLRVPESELAAQWTGEAWVVWNEFEKVRPVLALGHRGPEVVWLQASLARLGYYDGARSGLFDTATRESVRELQQERNIPADGVAGPWTRMVLYDLLEGYEVPRLVARPDASEGAG